MDNVLLVLSFLRNSRCFILKKSAGNTKFISTVSENSFGGASLAIKGYKNIESATLLNLQAILSIGCTDLGEVKAKTFECKVQPPEIDNGLITTENYSVIYNCSNGYKLKNENNMLYCNSEFEWEGEVPKCISGKMQVVLQVLVHLFLTLFNVVEQYYDRNYDFHIYHMAEFELN